MAGKGKLVRFEGVKKGSGGLRATTVSQEGQVRILIADKQYRLVWKILVVWICFTAIKLGH